MLQFVAWICWHPPFAPSAVNRTTSVGRTVPSQQRSQGHWGQARQGTLSPTPHIPRELWNPSWTSQNPYLGSDMHAAGGTRPSLGSSGWCCVPAMGSLLEVGGKEVDGQEGGGRRKAGSTLLRWPQLQFQCRFLGMSR